MIKFNKTNYSSIISIFKEFIKSNEKVSLINDSMVYSELSMSNLNIVQIKELSKIIKNRKNLIQNPKSQLIDLQANIQTQLKSNSHSFLNLNEDQKISSSINLSKFQNSIVKVIYIPKEQEIQSDNLTICHQSTGIILSLGRPLIIMISKSFYQKISNSADQDDLHEYQENDTDFYGKLIICIGDQMYRFAWVIEELEDVVLIQTEEMGLSALHLMPLVVKPIEMVKRKSADYSLMKHNKNENNHRENKDVIDKEQFDNLFNKIIMINQINKCHIKEFYNLSQLKSNDSMFDFKIMLGNEVGYYEDNKFVSQNQFNKKYESRKEYFNKLIDINFGLMNYEDLQDQDKQDDLIYHSIPSYTGSLGAPILEQTDQYIDKEIGVEQIMNSHLNSFIGFHEGFLNLSNYNAFKYFTIEKHEESILKIKEQIKMSSDNLKNTALEDKSKMILKSQNEIIN